jgi:hypothetical protein
MADRRTKEDSSVTLDASNAPAYERRARERRQVPLDAGLENKPRTKKIQREVWWVIAGGDDGRVCGRIVGEVSALMAEMRCARLGGPLE